MFKIHYEKTFFNKPEEINEKNFLYFKNELKKNPNFSVDKDYTSFSEKYKNDFIGILVSILVTTIGQIISDFTEVEFIQVIGALVGFTGMLILLPYYIGPIFLEGRSYATYIKERNEYYNKMTYLIITSNTYEEYLSKHFRK